MECRIDLRDTGSMPDTPHSNMSERTQVPLTKVHLRRLGRLADRQHAEYTRGSEDGGRLSAWADRRVAVVLAQGAALHYLHPEAGWLH